MLPTALINFESKSLSMQGQVASPILLLKLLLFCSSAYVARRVSLKVLSSDDVFVWQNLKKYERSIKIHFRYPLPCRHRGWLQIWIRMQCSEGGEYSCLFRLIFELVYGLKWSGRFTFELLGQGSNRPKHETKRDVIACANNRKYVAALCWLGV